MIHRIPITKARINLGRLVRNVHVNKEYYILEKDGIPVVGVMDVNEFEDYLETHNPKIKKSINRSKEDFLSGKYKHANKLVIELSKKRRLK